MKIEKKLWISLIAFALFAVLFSGWVYRRSTITETIPFDNTVSLETTNLIESGIKTESVFLPESFNNSQSLLFKTTHTAVEIWLDNDLLYQYGNEANAPKFMKSPGSCWHIVDVPPHSAGKHLQFKIIPVYPDYYGNTIQLYLGTRGDCILKIFTSSLGTLIVSCGILFAGCISLVLYFAIAKKKKELPEERAELFLNLGLFSLLISLWSLQQSGFLQFLIPDGRTLYYIDFFTFFLFPVPFNFLLYDICKSKYRRGALHLSMLYLTNMAVAVILQCTGIIDMFRILPVTHVIMVINALYTVGIIHYETTKGNNKDARNFKYPMYLIMGFGVGELIVYYFQKFQKTSILLPLGTMLFIIMLIWIQVSRHYDQYIQEQKLIYLQKLASTDLLTEAKNRNAYEKRIKQLDQEEQERQSTGIVLFDLDNLKVINDHFGHEKGDEALKLCCQCIRQVFTKEQNCFRIGGDEFAYLYCEEEKDLIEEKLKQLEDLLKETDKDLIYSLSVSAGFAWYLPDTDANFQDVIRRSDALLYHRKRKKKLARTSDSNIALIHTEKHLPEKISDEMILQSADYQKITPEELCGIIDLLSPSTDDYLYLIDFQNDFYYIAPQSLERFCISKNAFHNVMETHKDFVYGPDYPVLKAEFHDLLHSERCTHNLEYRWMDLEHKPVWINCRGHVVRDEQQNPLYMLGCINEIGEKQKADNVSGLFGESALKEYLGGLESSLKKGFLLQIGIDHFKEINENLGWDYGDFVLQETASCISSCLSKQQKVYKLTSDEFVILDTLSDDTQEAENLYSQIREKIDQFIETNEFTVMFTISGGILPVYNMNKTNYTEFMKRVDFSMNEAKRLGRNRQYVFEEKDYQHFLRLRAIGDELHNAVNHDFQGFAAFFQPVLRADNRQLFGAEALMRFSSEKFGTISPAEFIPILEESGLIIPVGRWMMREAMYVCRKIREELPDFHVSINISQVQISKSDPILDILAEMNRAGLPPEAIIIELTESDLLETNINERHFLKELKRAGIRLALDDFGTGYSNFHYLSELNPEIIKIDRSFTAKAVADENEYYLLKQFCHMIHNLDLKICIEGIENEEEWAKILQMDPDYSQGFLWGRPCAYEEFKRQFLGVNDII